MAKKQNTETDTDDQINLPIEGDFILADEVEGEELVQQARRARDGWAKRNRQTEAAIKKAGIKKPPKKSKQKSVSTDAELRNLKPPASGYYDVNLSLIPGLKLRVGKKKKSFRWDRGAGNKPRVITYGSYPELSIKKVRTMHEKAQERHAEGILEETEADAPKTVAELAEAFYEDSIVPVRRRPDVVRQVLDHDIIPQIGKLKLSTVNTLAVRRTVKVMVKRGAKSHAGRCLAIMKQMFSYGVEISVMENNPAASLKKRNLGVGDNTRDRVLSSEELREFWEVLDNHQRLSMQVRVGLQLLILLGIRSGELRQAKWSDINKGVLTVPVANRKLNPTQAKKAKPFLVPLDDFALSLFEKLRGLDDEWVFAGASGCIGDKVFSKATRRMLLLKDGDGKLLLPIPAFVPHDLRRTMRTGLGKLKIQPHIAELCLGHSLGVIIDTYDQHTYLDERRDALKEWSRHVQVVLGKVSNCVFHAKSATHSRGSLPPIPRESCHRFQ